MARNQCARRFTLVEMLVVIAMISILASLLLPFLEKALGSARQSTCLNNLRQQGIAGLSYASDNNDWLPVGKNLFFSLTLPYATTDNYTEHYQKTGKRETLYACPVPDSSSVANTNYAFDFRLGWYCLNTSLKNGFIGSGVEENIICKLSRWKNASSQFLRGDGGSISWIGKIEKYFIIDIDMQTFGFIHNASMSSLWLDGRATTARREDLYALYWNK